MQKRETILCNKIKKRLNELDKSFFFKTHGSAMQMAGISDLIGVYNGRLVAIEVKNPDNKAGATKLQQRFLGIINRCGGLGFVARSYEEVEAELNEMQ